VLTDPSKIERIITAPVKINPIAMHGNKGA
jgi:hypothetical protein